LNKFPAERIFFRAVLFEDGLQEPRDGLREDFWRNFGASHP
jgi:hypothetical protein